MKTTNDEIEPRVRAITFLMGTAEAMLQNLDEEVFRIKTERWVHERTEAIALFYTHNPVFPSCLHNQMS